MRYLILITSVVIGLSHSIVNAADATAGKLKAEQACQTCHGVDGISQLAMVPNLSGQRADYTKIQLEAYRSGQRNHAQMSIIAQSLTDEEIADLAEWYSKIYVTVSLPE